MKSIKRVVVLVITTISHLAAWGWLFGHYEFARVCSLLLVDIALLIPVMLNLDEIR